MNIEKDSCVQLNSGEVVALKAIEITSIPHISIINSKSEITEAETLQKYKSEPGAYSIARETAFAHRLRHIDL